MIINWIEKLNIFGVCPCTQCLKITEKVSFNIASEASYVYIWVNKSAKNGSFLRIFANIKWDIFGDFQTLWSTRIFHSFYLLSCLVLRLYLVSFHLEKAICTKKQSRKSSIKYIPGQTVVHFARSTWDPSHMGPPHLGVGLSHLRSLLWYPWPHFELHWLHSDQLDQPPLTGKSDLSNSIGIQKIVGNMPKILLWIVLPLFCPPFGSRCQKPL